MSSSTRRLSIIRASAASKSMTVRFIAAASGVAA
jgi:hypothetical protein